MILTIKRYWLQKRCYNYESYCKFYTQEINVLWLPKQSKYLHAPLSINVPNIKQPIIQSMVMSTIEFSTYWVLTKYIWYNAKNRFCKYSRKLWPRRKWRTKTPMFLSKGIPKKASRQLFWHCSRDQPSRAVHSANRDMKRYIQLSHLSSVGSSCAVEFSGPPVRVHRWSSAVKLDVATQSISAIIVLPTQFDW